MFYMKLGMLTYMVIILKYINQVLMLHINLYSAICQLYCNKTEPHFKVKDKSMLKCCSHPYA